MCQQVAGRPPLERLTALETVEGSGLFRGVELVQMLQGPRNSYIRPGAPPIRSALASSSWPSGFTRTSRLVAVNAKPGAMRESQ